MSGELTYKQAGVDIDNADATKRAMAASLTSPDPRVLNSLGAFASLFEAKFPDMADPVLVLKAEEPGSKQLLAFQHGYTRSICHDLINHLINDIAVMGARPLAVLDTVVCGKLERGVILELVDAMAEACRNHGCTLIGGETSEQPGVLTAGRYVLCANVIGVVDRPNIIDGSKISAGDVVLALQSSGPHTNGYTLIRTLIERGAQCLSAKVGAQTFLQAIMEPHRPYLGFLLPHFGDAELKGLAHITGGGIGGNLNRILPKDLGALVSLDKIRVPEVFKFIRSQAKVPDSDMLKTFNLGVGLALVCSKRRAESLARELCGAGCAAYPIGEIVSGDQSVNFSGALNW